MMSSTLLLLSSHESPMHGNRNDSQKCGPSGPGTPVLSVGFV